MNTHSVLLCALLLSATPGIATADHRVSAAGSNSVAPDKTFLQFLNDHGMDAGPWTALAAVQNPGDTPTAGKTFVSPDKRFSVQTTIVNREFYFVIKDAQTGLGSRLTSENFPILALEWSPDSKTILAVAHASMTSLIEVLHWNGHHWLQFYIDVPESEDDNNDKFHVVKWEFKTGYIKATYTVNNRTDNGGSSLALYRCTFDIDPANGKTSKVTKTTITRQEFVSLRNSSN